MFYTNLQALCQQKQITPAVVARDLRLSSGLPTFWKKGSTPKPDTLQKIADYFSVTVNDLLSDTPPAPSKLHREEGVKIPVLSTVGAGTPLEAINTFDQDDPDSWEEISQLEASRGTFFALRIRGNSMTPRIRHGDIVIVQMAEEYEDGDIVVALVNGDEGVCKQLEYRDDGIALKSFNPDYPPMIFTREQCEKLPVRLMGKCVELRGKL